MSIGSVVVLEVPGDAPHTVSVQRLNGRALERARQAAQFESVRVLKRMGGAAFQRELAATGERNPAAVATQIAIAKRRVDPLTWYDRYVVLYKGIKAWTYPETLTVVDEVNDDGEKERRIPTIDDMFDDDQVNFLAREILKLTKPGLFQTADEAETEKKSA